MLQVGDAFGFVSYNGCIKSDSAFPLLKNISELFIDNFENNLHNLLYKVMCKAFTSKNKWVKNLGFTIFLTFLYSNNI
jgi:hypothetical protein